jgi:uncharacterized protein (DUF1800 family)
MRDLISRLCGSLAIGLMMSGAVWGQGVAGPVVEVILLDGVMSEAWPDDGVVAFRREGMVGDLTVSFAISGSAGRGVDYSMAVGDTVTIPDGEREVWLSFTPLADALTEPSESIGVTVLPSALYSVSTKSTRRTVTLSLANAGSKPGAKEAVRFLWQAGYGPSADSTADADLIPENAESVMSLGFGPWIDAQFKKPVGLHQPVLEAMARTREPVYWDAKMRAWWSKSIGPTATDPLRQRVAFALSEVFVISDRLDVLSNQPRGMLNFYDVLVRGAFGNARDLLKGVTMHPCMGIYLSHLKNRKADAALGTFPDENFAREIMQLFSIGLWELNQDGTPRLEGGQMIPTYDNVAITNFARVFTGLSFGGPRGTSFWWPPEDWNNPMRMWDEYHDLEPKVLLNGVTLPARVASSNPDKGTAGMADIDGAIDCLFNHPNMGPFLGYRLIQRLVTSNPSPAYVGRVSAAFANNGKGVRGDMKAVIKAVLLDTEARSVAMLASSNFGKMKEPYLRSAGLARAFNARSTSGVYPLSYLDEFHAQQPLSSPSVFNFFRPGYSPAGPINDAHLVAPEFQILNAVTAVAGANYYYSAIRNGFNRWGDSNSARVVRANVAAEMALYNDVPALMRRLDMVLTGGMLDPVHHQLIRETVEAINETYWDWKKERIYMAIYLISTLPDYAIQR